MPRVKSLVFQAVNRAFLRPIRLALDSSKYRAVGQALTINGWTSENKLAGLYDLVRECALIPGDILEIGSAWGRSTILLGSATQKDIWSVDPHTGGLAFIESQQSQDSYQEFMTNIRNNGMADRVHVIKGTTEETLKNHLIQDSVRFCLAFIDGMHTPECVELDFQLAYPRLNPGGVIAFDDYYQPSVVEYARRIDQIAARSSQSLITRRNTGLVWFRKTDAADSQP